MAPRKTSAAGWPVEVVAKVLACLEAKQVASAQAVCTKWRKAGRLTNRIVFDEDTFPLEMSRTAVQMAMTRIIMQAQELADLSVVYIGEEDGLPDVAVASWLLKSAPTLEKLSLTNVFSYEAMCRGVRHPTIANVVATSLAGSKLRHLSLNGAVIPDSCTFAGLTHLEALELTDCHVSSATLCRVISSCPKLRTLKIEDLDGLTELKVRSATIQRLTISGEMTGTRFFVAVDCPDVRVLRLAQLKIERCEIAAAKSIAEVSMVGLSGGMMVFEGAGKCLRKVELKDVLWQHASAVMACADQGRLSCLQVEDIEGFDGQAVAIPHRSATCESPKAVTNSSLDLDQVAGKHRTLQKVKLGSGVWDRCIDTLLNRDVATKDVASAPLAWHHLSDLHLVSQREDEQSFAALDCLIRRSPLLQRVKLCGEIASGKPGIGRSPSMDSTSSAMTEAEIPMSPLSVSSACGDGDPEAQLVKRCGEFASRAMALQRRHPRTVVEVEFREVHTGLQH